MPYRFSVFLFALSAVFTISGCAGSNLGRGLDCLDQKNYSAAISEFDSAATIRQHPQIYFGYFQAYMGINDYENAIKYLTVGLAEFPNDAWINLCAGHWYMQRGNNSRKALYYYEKAGALRFGNPTNTMYNSINEYIGLAKVKIIADSLESESIEKPK